MRIKSVIYSTLVSIGRACTVPAQPCWKFRGCKLQLATGCFSSLNHESGTVLSVYLLLFTTLTHLRASGNCWKHFCSSDGHGTGDVELAPLNELINQLTKRCRFFQATCDLPVTEPTASKHWRELDSSMALSFLSPPNSWGKDGCPFVMASQHQYPVVQDCSASYKALYPTHAVGLGKPA